MCFTQKTPAEEADVGKFLSNLLHPLALNDHSLTDSFDAATQINNIPKHLFQEGYQFVSFDVESLFTSVPLSRTDTVQIILDRNYKDKLLDTKFQKRTLKKLILDCSLKQPLLSTDKFMPKKMAFAWGPL